MERCPIPPHAVQWLLDQLVRAVRYVLDACPRVRGFVVNTLSNIPVPPMLPFPPIATPTALLLLSLAQPLTGHAQGYPATRQDSTVDSYHGVTVPDPFRWLEQDDSPEVSSWVRAQNAFTQATLAQLPGRVYLAGRLRELSTSVTVSVPRAMGGRLYFTVHDGRQPQAVLYAMTNAGATPEPVFDPNVLSPDGSVAYGGYSVSPSGEWLSYSASRGGADYGTTHVRNLRTGRESADTLRGLIGKCWAGAERGLVYIGSPPPESDAPRITKQLRYHALGSDQSADPLIAEWRDNYRWAWCMPSDDHRRLVVVAERGNNAEIYILDAAAWDTARGATLVRVLADHPSPAPFALIGSTLYARTAHGAPRGAIVALDISTPDAPPRVVVPELPSGAILSRAMVAGDMIIVSAMQDATSRLLMMRMDGSPSGEVPLPGLGSLDWRLGGDGINEVMFTFSSFLTPSTVYRYDLRSGALEPFRPPRLPWDATGYETSQVFYSSRDGTRVPMFIVARRGVQLDGGHPVMLAGYGGYGSSFTPGFSPEVALWLELGGVYAVANIRGGGEYGEAWHRDGRLERKQNSYDDFIAAAEYLITNRWTRSERLAIQGHSNGGLLVGVMITQRPDLFAAAVASAGHHDKLRYHRFTVGAGWIPEFGSADDPSMFPVLRAYSPLHNVAPGRCYPATLLLAAEHDDRVVPAHSYKFAAALQEAQGCDRPILLRVATDASHGYAPLDARIAEGADTWAFVAARLGVAVPGQAGGR
jgi:prolyl oligopeptidase